MIAQIDTLRAMLAQGVIISHILPLYSSHGYGLALGPIAVWCFFVTSGYLNYLSARHKPTALAYYTARIRRLYPLLIMSYVVVAVILRSPINNDWVTLLPIVPNGIVELHNGVLWTLIVELHLYLVTPLLMLGVRKVTSPAIWLGLLLLMPMASLGGSFTLIWATGDPAYVDDRSILAALPFYFAGMLMAACPPQLPRQIAQALWAIVIALLVYVLVRKYAFIREGRFIPPALVVLWLFSPIPIWRIARTAMVWLGRHTYEIYVLHGLFDFIWTQMGQPKNLALVIALMWAAPIALAAPVSWLSRAAGDALLIRRPRNVGTPP